DVEAAHEAREQHELGSALAQRLDPGPLVLDAGAPSAAGIERQRFDAEPARAGERGRVGPVTHQSDDTTTQLPAARGRNERLEVGSLPGGEHGERTHG